MKFDENGKRHVINVDLDGTLTKPNGPAFWEGEPIPHQPMIDSIRAAYQAGNIIIVWTARQWEHAPETVGWLIKHRVPFHGIQMAKGGSDLHIDDKALSTNEFWGKQKHANNVTDFWENFAGKEHIISMCPCRECELLRTES